MAYSDTLLVSDENALRPPDLELVVLTMTRFLAYTLSLVFYHRQVRSHARGKCETFHECAKRIAYWFVAPNRQL